MGEVAGHITGPEPPRFRIVSGDDAVEVSAEVVRLLIEGWQFHGGMTVMRDPFERKPLYYVQPMVKFT